MTTTQTTKMTRHQALLKARDVLRDALDDVEDEIVLSELRGLDDLYEIHQAEHVALTAAEQTISEMLEDETE